MILRHVVAFVLTLTTCKVLAVGTATRSRAAMEMRIRHNPIRKVVSLLQDMQKSVGEEGEKETELYEKFMCYCKSGTGKLQTSVEEGKASIEQLQAKIEQDQAMKSQLEQDVASHKADRAEAEKTLKQSAAMRQKEAEEFAATSGEMKSNVQAMGTALEALKKGLSASMLQTGVGQLITNVVQNSPAVDDNERQMLLSYLQGGEEVAGGSDQIIGILEQMKETMAGDLKESVATEGEAKAAFATLTASKNKELSAASRAIEGKTARVGEAAVEIVQGKADLEGTEAAVAKDTEMAANLQKECGTKAQEYDAKNKIRTEEIQAISETIEMLNGDDALELFKKTLPGPASAFLQTHATTQSQIRRARAILERVKKGDRAHAAFYHMMMLSLGHRGKGQSGGAMDKVSQMIENMVKLLVKEQADDDSKKDFCVSELAKLEDETKALEGTIADTSSEAEELADNAAQTASEIETLQQGLADLDKSVAMATEQRKSEHAEFTQTAAANQAALDLLGMAKNRMNKFYAPSQYKAPAATPVPASFLVDSEGPIAFVQVRAMSQFRRGASSGVISMMDQMMKDVELDMQAGKMNEKTAQKDYEEAMQDAASKRSNDSKLIVTKEGEKAELTSRHEDLKETQATKEDQLNIAKGNLAHTHGSCDRFLESFDARKEARATESEGLKQSLSVLAGASVGFVQRS